MTLSPYKFFITLTECKDNENQTVNKLFLHKMLMVNYLLQHCNNIS